MRTVARDPGRGPGAGEGVREKQKNLKTGMDFG